MEHSIDNALASVYRRDLPGGGYVAINVERKPDVPRMRVSVERRAVSERRDGNAPVIIAEMDGDERSPTFTDLYRIAADNAAIARALLELAGPEPG